MSGGRIAGIVSIVVSVGAGVVGVLYLLNHYPRRGLAALIAFAALMIFGIILLTAAGRSSNDTKTGA
jgi:apolipoprotein N-acyltransferase